MKIFVTGRTSDVSGRLTTGDAETLEVSNRGRLEHHGSTMIAVATHAGRIVIRGPVTDQAHASYRGEIMCFGEIENANARESGCITATDGITAIAKASNKGKIYCRGSDTRSVFASSLGEVTIVGNPEVVTAEHHGSVAVFGKPRRINVRETGMVTVVTPEEQYEPDDFSNDSEQSGSLRIVTPGGWESNDFSYLNQGINRLFPDGQTDPLYVAYTALLQKCSCRYID